MSIQSAARVSEVLRALFDGCDGYVEFRAFAPHGITGRLFANAEDQETIKPFYREHQASNLYWGVSTRRDDRNGALENCVHLPALFADLDFKLSNEPDCRTRLAECPLTPSIVVGSGGGLQPYWLLREPADVPSEKHQLRDLLRRLAHWLAADVVAGEPARVLRVPGTLNQKYTPARRVTVEVFEAERRYNLCDFDFLPAEPVSCASQPMDLSKPIGELRNQSLYRLARALKGKHLPDAIVASTVRFLNGECCAPPLDDVEVTHIIRNALTQPDRPLASPDGRIRVRVATS